MLWDSQINSILSVADGSVAKMRERLTTAGRFSRGGEDLFSLKERVQIPDLDPPALFPRACSNRLPSQSAGSGVQWADLAAIQSQLQVQNQLIESLTKKLHDCDREKQTQRFHIQNLQEQVQRLHDELRERDGKNLGNEQHPGVEQKLEQWRREVGRELSILREHITQTPTLGNLDKSFSSKPLWEQLEELQRELKQLKTQLRRQKEDLNLQQTEIIEIRQQYECSCKKTLAELTDGYRKHGTDLRNALSQCSHTQEEVQQIRTKVSEIKDEVRRLGLRGQESSPVLSAHTSGPSPAHARWRQGAGGNEADSDSEDFSLTPSLAVVSSDDLSWLDEGDPAPLRRSPVKNQSRTDLQDPRTDLEDAEEESDVEDLLDDDDFPETGSDLSLSDL